MGRRLSLGGLIRLASSRLRHKLHQARLDLTGTTQAQLVVRKATRGRPYGPDAGTLKRISRAAFEIDDYWRIVGVLHKRLENGKQWRKWYQALTVLEHLVIHGPDSASREFQPDSDAIRSRAATFRHVHEGGFDWGLALRERSERVLQLLERGPLLRQERERARAPVRDAQDFGGGRILCADDVTLPASGAGECRSNSPWDANAGKDCSSGNGVRGAAEERDPWSRVDPALEETAAWKEQEWGQEMLLWRGGNGSGAVTVGATCAAAAVVLVDESTPLLADDSLVKTWF